MATLSGKILSRKSNKPLPYKIETKIKLNEVVYENAKINRTTGEYYMEIPIGQAYIVNAAAINISRYLNQLTLVKKQHL